MTRILTHCRLWGVPEDPAAANLQTVPFPFVLRHSKHGRAAAAAVHRFRACLPYPIAVPSGTLESSPIGASHVLDPGSHTTITRL